MRIEPKDKQFLEIKMYIIDFGWDPEKKWNEFKIEIGQDSFI